MCFRGKKRKGQGVDPFHIFNFNLTCLWLESPNFMWHEHKGYYLFIHLEVYLIISCHHRWRIWKGTTQDQQKWSRLRSIIFAPKISIIYINIYLFILFVHEKCSPRKKLYWTTWPAFDSCSPFLFIMLSSHNLARGLILRIDFV